MAHRPTSSVPADLRARLEEARLDLLALFRALDRMDLTPAEIPQRLIRQLFELDADFVEALWASDQPPGRLDLGLMLRDPLASLDQLPEASARFTKNRRILAAILASRGPRQPCPATSGALRCTH